MPKRPLLAGAATVLAVWWAVMALPAAAQAEPELSSTDIAPGQYVVSLDERGEVWAVGTDGHQQLLATGLDHPRGVAVLEDRTVLVAEAGADRVVGFGGSIGDEIREVIAYPQPEALVAAPEGFVVSSLQEGRVSSVDIAGEAVTDLAAGLANPAAVLVRPDGVFVVEAGAQRVVRLDEGGPVAVVGGFELPVGLANGVDGVLYVTDVGTGEVVEIAGPYRDVVAELPRPSHVLAVGPQTALDDPVTLLVATAEGLVELDPNGDQTRVLGPDGPMAHSAAVAPVEVPPPPMAVAAADSAAGSPTEGSGEFEGEIPGAVVATGDSETGWSAVLGLVLGALAILACVVAVFWVHLRRANATGEDLLGEDLDLDRSSVGNLADTFGPCLGAEVELEQAEIVAARASGAVEAAQRHLSRIRAQAANPIRHAELHLASEAGHWALDAYRSGRMGARELAAAWREAGETEAIEQVRHLGRSPVPGDGRGAVASNEQIEAALSHATADIERLRERLRKCEQEVAAAKQRLAQCREATAALSV